MKPLEVLKGKAEDCRTPPGVRELKQVYGMTSALPLRRTPPGVRELKPVQVGRLVTVSIVAPLPGCVN